MPPFRFIASLVLAFALAAPLAAQESLVRLKLDGKPLEGTPLAFNSRQVFLLARDGQLFEFPPAQAQDYSLVPSGFKSYSQAEIRGGLMREFGRGFEVSGVGHYLVVHPSGQKDQWAPRFEELYRSFVQYYAARGWQLTEPRFPLVAVVYPRQSDFQRQATKEGVPPASGFLGYYSTSTNRILLYDVTAGRSDVDWTVNAETIVHEAAHQSAFNTGVHSRFGVAPRWVVEGIGTMFEARGVWQSRRYPNRADRVNRGLLSSYRSQAATGRPGAEAIAEIVSSDRMFQTDPNGAYAQAWALSFYLCECEPRKYFQYLSKTAAIPAFSNYRSPQRLKDFTDVFGTDLTMLDARVQRFVAGLK
ncbi:MAG: DUF1570 domain-containing protein [Pirellulaceae bacterium]